MAKPYHIFNAAVSEINKCGPHLIHSNYKPLAIWDAGRASWKSSHAVASTCGESEDTFTEEEV
eukprot:6466729-Amphidinium_carterae.1